MAAQISDPCSSIKLYCASWDPLSGAILKLHSSLGVLEKPSNLHLIDVEEIEDLDEELGSTTDGGDADDLEPPFALVQTGTTSLLVKKTDYDWKSVADKKITFAELEQVLIQKVSSSIRQVYANTALGSDLTTALGGASSG